jgi:hypothetical protein
MSVVYAFLAPKKYAVCIGSYMTIKCYGHPYTSVPIALCSQLNEGYYWWLYANFVKNDHYLLFAACELFNVPVSYGTA